MEMPAVVRPIDATSLKSILEFSLSIGQLNTVGDVLSLIDSEPEIEIPKGDLFWRDAKKSFRLKTDFISEFMIRGLKTASQQGSSKMVDGQTRKSEGSSSFGCRFLKFRETTYEHRQAV